MDVNKSFCQKAKVGLQMAGHRIYFLFLSCRAEKGRFYGTCFMFQSDFNQEIKIKPIPHVKEIYLKLQLIVLINYHILICIFRHTVAKYKCKIAHRH